MAHDFLITARKLSGLKFIDEPGPVKFLKVNRQKKIYDPDDVVSSPKAWSEEVIGLADGDENPNSISPTGDILVFIHGYANDAEIILQRTRQLSKDLKTEGWRGQVVAFDWPSDNKVLNYWEDRADAAAVAGSLVEKCVKLIAEGQARDCITNIHLLGHSTGAYVIMEAFVQAEKNGELFKSDWRIGQVAFIGGDVSSSSLSTSDAWSAPMFRRIMRLTNYSNPNDTALAVSSAKRLGVAPRSGRVGLPADSHPKSINVDCGSYFVKLDPKKSTYFGDWTHSWHIGNRVFARDLAMSLEGAVDRFAIPTRVLENGKLSLRDQPRPAYMSDWEIKNAAKRVWPDRDKGS